MAGRFNTLALALLTGGLLTVSLSLQSRAATSSTLDILSDDRAGDASSNVDVGAVKPLARPIREPAKALPSGNPLWSVPLSVLSATQEHPIFSASRRSPQRAVVARSEQAVVPPPPAEPERPSLALIGAVVGDSDAIAVFLDRASQKIVRRHRSPKWHIHMSMRIDAARQNEETGSVNNRVSFGVHRSAHLANRAAFHQHIRLLNTICGDNSAILNQNSHTCSELFNAGVS